jgi:hypothetical protein
VKHRRAAGLGERADLDDLVAAAWRAYDDAARLPSRVSPASPILFFGDLDAYLASPLRVVTVGLNPSLAEFPVGDPFSRFPLAEGPEGREPERYLAALSAYYRTNPYRGWFSAFEPLLNGAGASYYAGEPSTALHTDICSPAATNPTWSKLHDADRATLEADGGPLWHRLLEALRPDVVAVSVAKHHLARIDFETPGVGWDLIHTFDRTGSGELRSRPYEVQARWYRVGDERSLFVFGPAAQKPFGLLHDSQKRELGAITLEAYRDGR